MASSKASTSRLGSHIVLGGLLLQIILFGGFMVIALVFHLRIRAASNMHHATSIPWKKFLYILYITSTLIMIRSIVRVAEFVEGFEGTIILHEVYLYVFDAIPMAAVMYIFNIWYPSNISKQATKRMVLSEDVESTVQLSSLESAEQLTQK